MPDDGDQQSQHVHSTKRILCGPCNHDDDDDDGDVSWGNNFYGSFLIPGGRYLILFHDDQLSLYDLGNTPDILLDHKTRVLASVKIQYGGCFLVNPSPDGLALRLFLLASEPIKDGDDLAEVLVVPSCSFSCISQFESISVGITGSRYTKYIPTTTTHNLCCSPTGCLYSH